jgi:ribulose-phosphate 3-epimerase
MSKFIISASLLSSDFTHLEDQIHLLEAAGVDWLHVDVLDGVFAPNISMGPVFVEACRRVSNLPIDVHLMIVNPERHIEAFQKAGATSLTVHLEGNAHIHRVIQNIHDLGCSAGLAINPGTPISAAEAILSSSDLVLIMSVNPGFSGQKFIPESVEKVAQAQELIEKHHWKTQIQIDGGINTETLPLTYKAGARNFVTGNALFKHPAGIAGGAEALRKSI